MRGNIFLWYKHSAHYPANNNSVNMLTRITKVRSITLGFDKAMILTGEPQILICRHVWSSHPCLSNAGKGGGGGTCGFINLSRRKGWSSRNVNKNLWFTWLWDKMKVYLHILCRRPWVDNQLGRYSNIHLHNSYIYPHIHLGLAYRIHWCLK